jgi:DNA-binding cell septation regulator SpoVG
MVVSEVNITPVKPTDGLIAFASCVIDGQLYIGSLGVHQRLDGTSYRITYPTQKIGSRQLNFYHPITKDAGRVIEQAIIAKCVEIFERSDEQYGRHSKDTHNRT